MLFNHTKYSNKLKPILAILSLCCISFSNAYSQITIVPGQAAAALAQKLAGAGVTITGASSTCPVNSNGIFVATNSNLGLDSGIILATGRTSTSGAQAGANGASTLFPSSDNGAPGDPVLNAYISKTTFNACALDFDFKPLGDTVKFDYVFSSEEYTNYSCTDFNDVFAFWITGPGIAGSKNLALIPGTIIPVAINSTTDTAQVAEGPIANCTAMGPGSPFGIYYAGVRSQVTYDGSTKVLRAIQKVIPCSTYHLRLIIADVTDSQLDSGVWLKAGSLSSNVSQIASSGLGSGTDTPYCVRSCYPGKFTFNRQEPLPTPLTVRYIIAGDAINGVDYAQITDSVVIPANSTQAILNINALPTPLPTGSKMLKLYLLSFTCDPLAPPVVADSAVLEIMDELKIKLNTPDTTICFGDTVHVTGVGDDAYYTYKWTPGTGVWSTNTVNTTIVPFQTTTYTLTASFSVCPDVQRQITIEVQPIPNVDAGRDTTICEWDSVQLHATVKPDWYKDYSFTWSPPDDLNLTNQADVVQKGFKKTTLFVTVNTTVGCTGRDSIIVDIHPGNFASTPTDIGVCPRDSVEIKLSGGVKYLWTPASFLSGTTDSIEKSSPPGPFTYTVYVTDQFTCRDTLSVFVDLFPAGVLDLGEDVYLHSGEKYQMDAKGNCLKVSWFPHIGLTSVNIPNPLANPKVNTRYFVTGSTDLGCKTSDTIDVYMARTEVSVPNAFTPLGINHELKIVMRGIATLKYFRIFNRWGEKVFETSDINKGWDGRYNGEDQPFGVYLYTIDAETDDGRRFSKNGNVTLIR